MADTETGIPYAALTRAANRAVVREAMRQVEAQGLPGAHHFYIQFSTTHEGVLLSPWLQKEYPELMTIVLQNQFSELKVTDSAFSVRLGFGGLQETLCIPFSAVLAFCDPSVDFGLIIDDVFEPMTTDSKSLPEQMQDTGNVVYLDNRRTS